MAESLLDTPGMTEGIMANAKSPQEFQELLQHMLAKELNSHFIEAPLAKNRIESHIESNLAMHEFIYDFLPDGTVDGDAVKKTDDPEAYNIVATSSLTLQSLTPPEKRQFRKLQSQTKNILSNDELPAHVS